MPPALQPQMETMTLEQYEALPEDRKVEIIENVVYDMASPSQIHQTLSMELSNIIYNYIKDKKGLCRVFSAPFDVKLSDHPLTIVQPDIMVICDKDKLDGKRCNGAPDFIIEIVSPNNAAHDYIHKLNYYEIAGVREYWIVDPTHQRVVVYNFGQTDFEMKTYTFADKIKVSIYDDLYIDFSELDLGI